MTDEEIANKVRKAIIQSINVLTDKGEIAYYSYDFDCWIAEPSSAEIDPPIAWCRYQSLQRSNYL